MYTIEGEGRKKLVLKIKVYGIVTLPLHTHTDWIFRIFDKLSISFFSPFYACQDFFISLPPPPHFQKTMLRACFTRIYHDFIASVT